MQPSGLVGYVRSGVLSGSRRHCRMVGMQGQDRDEQLIGELRRAWLRHERSLLWVVYGLGVLVVVVHVCCWLFGVAY